MMGIKPSKFILKMESKYVQHMVLILCMLMGLLQAQVEKVYDENGMLRTVNPLNRKGEFEGMGLQFYPDGAKKIETPYRKGQIHGIQKEYYKDGKLKSTATYEKGRQIGTYKVLFPDGQIKMKQDWEDGRRTGNMEVFYPDGQLRIFALLKNDSILFAQNFEENGKMSSEKLGYISQKLKAAHIMEPLIFLENGQSLRSGLTSRAQIIIPRVPSSFLRFESEDALIEKSQDDGFPLLITAKGTKDEVDIYVLVKLSSFVEPSVKKKLSLKVK